MAADGLIEYRQNPNHKRAALVVLTARGKRAFDMATERQVRWVNALADGVRAEGIEAALTVLIELEGRLRKGSNEG
jgi:DNA-binding MarR family transcriptional regulator